MKKNKAIFLQILIVLISIGTLTFMLWEPHLEGRNVNATIFDIYFNDPFLACAYIASIAFFMALYQTFKVVGYAGQNNLFSQSTLKSLRIIKYCARTLVVFVLTGEAYLFIVRPEDDIAGGVFMGLLAIVLFGTIAIVATRFEKNLQNKIISNQ